MDFIQFITNIAFFGMVFILIILLTPIIVQLIVIGMICVAIFWASIMFLTVCNLPITEETVSVVIGCVGLILLIITFRNANRVQ